MFNKPSQVLLSQGNSHSHHQKAFEGRAQKAFGHPCSVPPPLLGSASSPPSSTTTPVRRLLATPAVSPQAEAVKQRPEQWEHLG